MTRKAFCSWVLLASLALGLMGGYCWQRLERRELALPPPSGTPIWSFAAGLSAVVSADKEFVVLAGESSDELLAYLRYDYLRSRRESSRMQVLLTTRETGGRPVYRFYLYPWNRDAITAASSASGLVASGYIAGFELAWVARSVLADWQQQTRTFEAAYSLPVRRHLEGIGRGHLLNLMARFIHFKSATDARIRRGDEPAPEPLSPDEARGMAANIITVAEFYELPLEFFLGIGAMENNYMDIRGDLRHVVWKRRAQKGDIILRRRRGRVLVLNYATGPWQITRETLRYVHRLFLKDTRDYGRLPLSLRPPRKLNLDEIDSGLLTTYAGLLFRHLIDRFNGDVARAVGAYNGGIRNPNMGYEEGVRLVADYARNILEQAAALNNQSVSEMSFFAPSRRSPEPKPKS
ncbi:MAG TPA: hypothetical protein VLE22_20645 [Bryobacteraceae bacterium]|nr:hypothetical protein [Bryobacteraceae bacterium]